jgi:hypothetical protein
MLKLCKAAALPAPIVVAAASGHTIRAAAAVQERARPHIDRTDRRHLCRSRSGSKERNVT